METREYVLRRLVGLVPTVGIISVITFGLINLAGSPISIYVTPTTPQDQVELLRQQYHLDEPIYVQYLYWMQGVLQGELGHSVTAGQPVAEAIVQKAPATFELGVAGMVIAVVVSLVLGTLSGRYENSLVDHASRVFAVLGMSTPRFWSGLMLIFVGYVILQAFPIGRADPEIWASIAHPTNVYTLDAILAGSPRAFFDAVWHLLLPAFVVGYTESGIITRQLRSELVEKKHEEFVASARSRGLGEGTVYLRHILRNALIPTTTVAGMSFGFLMRGVVVVELVFAWPGLGRWVAEAALNADYAAVMGFMLLTAVVVILTNLVVDVVYAGLDPRVELGE